MRYIFLLLLVSLSFLPLSFAQFIELDENKIKERKVLDYKIMGLSHEKKKSNYDGKLFKHVIYNPDGKIIQDYQFNMAIVNTTDSVFYTYNENGNLTEILKIYHEVSEGIRSTFLTRKTYDKNRITKSEFFIDENPTSTTYYYYDGKGRIIKELVDGDLTLYVYNPAGQLLKIKQYLPSEKRKDTLVSSFKYDVRGNKTEELLKDAYRTTLSKYTYDHKNQVIKKDSKVESVLGNYSMLVLYAYDEKGNCIERKTSKAGVLTMWEQFRYDDHNMPIEEIWMNLKTGEKKTSFIWKYTFFE